MSDREYIFGNCSHVGRVRTENQDYFGFFSTTFGDLFLVCDGVGGHKGGSVASREAVEWIKQYFDETELTDPVLVLEKSIQYADKLIMQHSENDPDLYGMGTTCVAFLLQNKDEDGAKAWVAHAGDSRLYRIRKNVVEQLTKDHSKVQEMVDAGLISVEQARDHREGNIITKSLGGNTLGVEPDVEQVDICKGDRFVICTDGVSGLVTDDSILNLSKKNKVPQSFAESLVGLANDLGGEDNSTVQVIDITAGPEASSSAKFSRSKKLNIPLIVSIAGITLALIIVFLIMNPFGNKDFDIKIEASSIQINEELNGNLSPDDSRNSYHLVLDGNPCKITFIAHNSLDQIMRMYLYDNDLVLLDSIEVASPEDTSFYECTHTGDLYLMVNAFNLESSIGYTISAETVVDDQEIPQTVLIIGTVIPVVFPENELEVSFLFNAEIDQEYSFMIDGENAEQITISVSDEVLETIDGISDWTSTINGEVQVRLTQPYLLLGSIQIGVTEKRSTQQVAQTEAGISEISNGSTQASIENQVINTFGIDGYNEQGLDIDGYDRNNRDSLGFHRVTGLDRDGYDSNGINPVTSRDRDGYDIDGYDQYGFDRDGYDRDGFLPSTGRDRYGYDQSGLDERGFDRDGIFRDSGNDFDEDGYRSDGFHVNTGLDRDGYDRGGYHVHTGLNRAGYDKDGYDADGYNSDGLDRFGNPHE